MTTIDNTAVTAALNELHEHAEGMLTHFRSACAINEDELLTNIGKIAAVRAQVLGNPSGEGQSPDTANPVGNQGGTGAENGAGPGTAQGEGSSAGGQNTEVKDA